MAEQRTVAPANSQARVFNTFGRVGADQSKAKKAERLANSLGVALKAAQPIVKQYKEEEIKEGIAARTTGILQDGTKIRKGEMPPDKSTFWMQGFRIGEGRSMALDVQQEMTQRYESAGIKNSTRPEEYQAWYQENLQEVLGGRNVNDQYVSAGLMESLPGLQQNFNSIHVKNMRGNLERETLNLLSKETVNLFNNKKSNTGVFANSTNPGKDLVANTSKLIQDFVNVNGVDPKKARAAAYDTYLQEAVRLANEGTLADGDPIDLIDSFPRTERNAEINAKIESDKQKIRAATNSRITRLRNERTEAVFQASRGLLTNTLTNPNYFNTQEGQDQYSRIAQVDPIAAEKLKSVVSSQAERVITVDASVEQKHLSDYKRAADNMIAVGDLSGAQELANEYLDKGLIQRPGVLANMMDHVETNGLTRPFLDSSTIKDYDEDIKASLVDPKGTLASTLMNLNNPMVESEARGILTRMWNREKKTILYKHIKLAQDAGKTFNIRDTDFNNELAKKVTELSASYNKSITDAIAGSQSTPSGASGAATGSTPAAALEGLITEQ